MNSLQIKNILTPIFGAIGIWIASKLNFLPIPADTWTQIVSAVGFGAVTILLGFFNKTSSVLDTAGNQPNTVVVTTKENANALPANPDVIAATPAINAAVAASK